MDMTFLKRICTVILLMLLTIYYAESKVQDSRFSFNHPPIKKLIEPLSYDITLELSSVEDNFTYCGESRNNIVIENPTSKIRINALGLTIQEGKFRLFKYPYKNLYNHTNYYYSNETETFIFDFETDVPSGFYAMYIKFRGNLSENEIGFYRATCEDCNAGTKWIFTTQLKPTAAWRVFPCWDEPSLKARFFIALKHHRNYTALSNMPIQLQARVNNDIIWTIFHPTPIIPTYLVAFSLTDFVCNDRKANEFKTRVCCRPLVKHQIIFALNTSVDVMSYLLWYMDISPQLSKITSIGLSDFPYEVTGNWGLNIYRESLLIHNKTLHSVDHKLDVSTYVASIVARQWFGNLVSPTWWTHMWFFQTLALFYGAKACAEVVLHSWHIFSY